MWSRSPWGRCKQAGVCAARGPERCGFDGDAGPSGINQAQLSRSSSGELPQAKPAQARAVQGSQGAACALGEPRCTTLKIRVQPHTRQTTSGPPQTRQPLLCPHHMHLTPTLSTSPTEEDRRCALGNRSAKLAGLGKAGPGTCGPSSSY